MKVMNPKQTREQRSLSHPPKDNVKTIESLVSYLLVSPVGEVGQEVRTWALRTWEMKRSPGRYQELDLFIKVLRLLCPNLTDAPNKRRSQIYGLLFGVKRLLVGEPESFDEEDEQKHKHNKQPKTKYDRAVSVILFLACLCVCVFVFLCISWSLTVGFSMIMPVLALSFFWPKLYRHNHWETVRNQDMQRLVGEYSYLRVQPKDLSKLWKKRSRKGAQGLTV